MKYIELYSTHEIVNYYFSQLLKAASKFKGHVCILLQRHSHLIGLTFTSHLPSGMDLLTRIMSHRSAWFYSSVSYLARILDLRFHRITWWNWTCRLLKKLGEARHRLDKIFVKGKSGRDSMRFRRYRRYGAWRKVKTARGGEFARDKSNVGSR